MSHPATKKRFVAVDASIDSKANVGGIGVAFLGGGGPIAAEGILVGHGGIIVAEAQAVTRGLTELADMYSARAGSVVITDNAHVYKAIVGADRPLWVEGLPETVDYARQLMTQCGLKVELRSRREVRDAHKMARIALEIFRAALREEGTWSSPCEVTQLSPTLLRAVPDFPPIDPPPISA